MTKWILSQERSPECDSVAVVRLRYRGDGDWNWCFVFGIHCATRVISVILWCSRVLLTNSMRLRARVCNMACVVQGYFCRCLSKLSANWRRPCIRYDFWHWLRPNAGINRKLVKYVHFVNKGNSDGIRIIRNNKDAPDSTMNSRSVPPVWVKDPNPPKRLNALRFLSQTWLIIC